MKNTVSIDYKIKKEMERTISIDCNIKKENAPYYNELVGDICYRYNKKKNEDYFSNYALCSLFTLSASYLRPKFSIERDDDHETQLKK
jgi:hypothetical protein